MVPALRTVYNVVYAVIKAIDMATGKVVIVSDSQYVYRGINNWMHKWRKNGWLTPQGPVNNTDLWVHLLVSLDLCSPTIKWLWCPSHTGIEGNERADHLVEVGRLSSPLYDKCHPGTVVRPMDVDLLHPSRQGQTTGTGTPIPRIPVPGGEVLTPKPTRAHHSMGLRCHNMEGVTSPPQVIDITSPMTPMPGMLLDFNTDSMLPRALQ